MTDLPTPPRPHGYLRDVSLTKTEGETDPLAPITDEERAQGLRLLCAKVHPGWDPEDDACKYCENYFGALLDAISPMFQGMKAKAFHGGFDAALRERHLQERS